MREIERGGEIERKTVTLVKDVMLLNFMDSIAWKRQTKVDKDGVEKLFRYHPITFSLQDCRWG